MELKKHNQIIVMCTPKELRDIADDMDKHIHEVYNDSDGDTCISEFESREPGKTFEIVFQIDEERLPRNYMVKS